MSDSYWMVERDVKAIAEHSPFIGEQLAIDFTKIAVELCNARRGAESGLRALQSRPFLGRMLDSFTGKGQHLQAAIGSDLLAAENAVFRLVGVLMRNHERTEDCQERGQEYLCELKEDVVPGIVAELQDLRRHEQHGTAMRHLNTRYEAGTLHPGTGPILGAALYVAQVERIFASVPFEDMLEERTIALEKATKIVGEQSAPLATLLVQTVDEVEEEALERVGYVLSQRTGPALKTLELLVARRMEGNTLHAPPILKELDGKIAQFNQEKEAAVAAFDFEKAAHFRDQADKLKRDRERIACEWWDTENAFMELAPTRRMNSLDLKIERFNREKKKAVAAFDFEKAAYYRDQADKIKGEKKKITRECHPLWLLERSGKQPNASRLIDALAEEFCTSGGGGQ